MATSSRESRRRKILDRGSDRLALITRGATSPNQDSENNLNAEPHFSDFPTGNRRTLSVDLHSSVAPIVGAVRRYDSDRSHDFIAPSEFPKQEPVVEDASHDVPHSIGSSEEPHVPERETHVEATRPPASVVSRKIESRPISSTDQDSSVSTSTREQHVEPQTYKSKFFTPSQISSAVGATQYARIFCSAMVAVMVVLSYVGFPLLGSYVVKGILCFRPLFLLLLTNITVVMQQLLLDNQRETSYQRPVSRDGKTSSDGSDWAEQAGKALEVGMMMHKVIDAIFMDCSVYAVIVISGLSFC